MRNLLCFTACAALFLASCSQNNNVIPNTNNNNTSPPQYYVKAKVNGVPWQAGGGFGNSYGDVFDFGTDSVLNMYGQGDYSGAAHELFFEIENSYGGTGTYTINDVSFEFHKFLSNDDNFMYYSIGDSSDFITVSTITTNSFTGTFRAVVVRYTGGDTLRITDGEFVVLRD